MKFYAHINIMPKTELLDPQGKVVVKNLPNIGIEGVEDARIGKHVMITVEAESQDAAHDKVDRACSKLLANLIMEDYDFVLEEVD